MPKVALSPAKTHVRFAFLAVAALVLVVVWALKRSILWVLGVAALCAVAYKRLFAGAPACAAKAGAGAADGTAAKAAAGAPETTQLLQKNAAAPAQGGLGPPHPAATQQEVPMYDTYDDSIKPTYTEDVGRQNQVRFVENQPPPDVNQRREFMFELSKDLHHHKDAYMQEIVEVEEEEDDSEDNHDDAEASSDELENSEMDTSSFEEVEGGESDDIEA